MPTRDQIVESARLWLGTPWRHQHRARGQACDCAGLLIGIASELGLAEHIEIPAYGRHPSAGTLLALCRQYMDEISIGEAQPADVLVLAWSDQPGHLAMVSDRGIIHAHISARRVVEHTMPRDWIGRIRHAFRFRGVV